MSTFLAKTECWLVRRGLEVVGIVGVVGVVGDVGDVGGEGRG